MKSSPISRSFAMLLLFVLSLAACAGRMNLPHKDTIPTSPALPIDGLWRNKETGVLFQIEQGRMFVHSGFDPAKTQAGGIVAINIRQIGPRDYTCNEFIANGLTGDLLGWANTRITMEDAATIRLQSQALPSGGFGGSTYFFQIANAENAAWLGAQHQAPQIIPSPTDQTTSSGSREGDISQGSCVVISPDGLIATAAHVVAGQSQVGVRLSDGRILAAQVESFSRLVHLSFCNGALSEGRS